jgi:hypothetical protein
MNACWLPCGLRLLLPNTTMRYIVNFLESLFTTNITEKTKYFTVMGNEMVTKVEKIIPRHVLGQLVRTSPTPSTATTTTTTDGSTNNNCFLTLSSENLLCNTLLAHSPSSSLRKEIYYQSNTSIGKSTCPRLIDTISTITFEIIGIYKLCTSGIN